MDWQLMRAITTLNNTAARLLAAKSANGESSDVHDLAELICIESRSTLIAYFDGVDWMEPGTDPEATLAFRKAILLACKAAAGTRYHDRVKERLHDFEEHLRQHSE